MVHRPEITEYVQRLKEYRQRQNRKYKQRREGVLYRKQKNMKTNTILSFKTPLRANFTKIHTFLKTETKIPFEHFRKCGAYTRTHPSLPGFRE